MTQTALTTNEKFNLIAPIAIYHHADLCYKQKAQRAFKKAQKLYVVPLEQTKLDEADVGSLYNELFEQVVYENRPSWSPFIDKWGAKGFKDQGEVVFSGDDSGFYPWYETAELLIERLGLR